MEWNLNPHWNDAGYQNAPCGDDSLCVHLDMRKAGQWTVKGAGTIQNAAVWISRKHGQLIVKVCFMRSLIQNPVTWSDFLDN